MKYSHILSEFYFQPWNIVPDKHRALGSVLQQHLRAEKPPEEPKWHLGTAVPNSETVVGPVDEDGRPMIPQLQKIGPVAVIPVYGVLGRHLSFLSLWCGGCDYENVTAMIDLAEGDPGIRTIVFDFDSPGGSSTGNQECAERFGAITKPTVAYSDKTCCSAAYYLASQCADVIFSPSAMVVNIGSYLAAIDNSREWEMMGWKLELFRSGPLKGIGEDGKTFTQAERDFLQSQVTYCADTFKSAVRAARPQVSEEDMQGQWLFGAQAAERGLADAVANDLSEVVALSIEGINGEYLVRSLAS